MQRRGFFAALFGVSAAAIAQDTGAVGPVDPPGRNELIEFEGGSGSLKERGDYFTSTKPTISEVRRVPPREPSKYFTVNNRCPVCGHMAEPAAKEDPFEEIHCGEGHGCVKEIDENPRDELIRCEACNAAFYRDVEIKAAGSAQVQK